MDSNNDKLLLEATGLCKSYGKRTIIKDADFRIYQGEIIAIVGPNAGGKSTLLKILSGTSRPDSGTIRFEGNELKSASDFATHIGYIPQDNPLFEEMTVNDNLKFWTSDVKGGYKKLTESGLIERMGLTPYLKYKVRRLSGGLKKRVSITCVISDSPKVLILDEPGASLDVVFKEEIKNFLKAFRDEGGAVIIVSHEEGELALADRMYIMGETELRQLERPVYAGELKELITK